MQYDIFNGDADGIFALHQYRLAYPAPEAKRITGVKRDIKLLQQLESCKNGTLTVFDISLDSNRDALTTLLAADNNVLYFDHHFAGDIPDSPYLETHIEPSAEICTSLIVNGHLKNRYPLWAVCGAYGDNLHNSAAKLEKQFGVSKTEAEQLRELGELFNYNGYGASLEDLHFTPDALYLGVASFESPFDFIENAPQLVQLREGYANDMDLALGQAPLPAKTKNRVYTFPDAPWARRVSGVFSNLKAREKENSAHAIITENRDTSLRISVRAPLADRRDADTLCKAFPTGGGRAAAAGINALPVEMLDSFLDSFHTIYS